MIQSQKYEGHIAATGRKRGHITLPCVFWWSEVSVHTERIRIRKVSKD